MGRALAPRGIPGSVVAKMLAPVEAAIVQKIPSPVDKETRNSFYYGMAGWAPQWEAKDTAHRKRIDVSPLAIDASHKLATLQACIASTVGAYTDAVTALNVMAPPNPKALFSIPKVIHQGIGHGHVEPPGAPPDTTVDFGAQLRGFSQHEFRVGTKTFLIYQAIKDANDFAVQIGVPDPTPKERAQSLLAIDGLVAIRNAIKGQVSRLRIVSCRIGKDLDFMQSLAWVIGRCRKGEAASNNVVLEAYEWKVGAIQANSAAPFRIGLEDPVSPATLQFEADADTEFPPPFAPPKGHLITVDPSTIRAPNPNDPLNFGASPPAAMKLGECPSLANLIPPDVLKK